ncbi:hypothetical protein H0H92_000325 [Tricholoma furcatifolium]|nr:hypothetical protein H0H92_000325 [Tricholoma furcatifolium]
MASKLLLRKLTYRILQAMPQKVAQRTIGRSGPNAAFDALETAIAKYDDVAQLLLSLDNLVNFNAGLRDSRHAHVPASRRQTILDWVRFSIKTLSEKISSGSGNKTPGASLSADQSISPWKDFYAKLLKEREASASSPSPDHDLLSRQQACQSYLVDIERLLVARGAKTWNDIYPDQASMQIPGNENTVSRGRKPSARYAELYEACFAGDNQKIEQMCLPKEQIPSTGPPPLNIFVEANTRTGRLNISIML